MERTSPRRKIPTNPFERKERSIVQKPDGMNSQGAHLSRAGQWSEQQLTYFDDTRNNPRELRSDSESNAVQAMFALLERCEDNLKFIAAYTRAQGLEWNNNIETDERKEDAEMDDRASQTSACFFSDDEAIWQQAPMDDDFITPSVTETTEDDLRAALRELHEQVTETMSETDVFLDGYSPDEVVPGRRCDTNDVRLMGGATAVKGDMGNEIEYVQMDLTDRAHRDQLDTLSSQEDVEEEDSFSVDMSGIEEKGCRSLCELLSEESDLEPGEIFRVRNG